MSETAPPPAAEPTQPAPSKVNQVHNWIAAAYVLTLFCSPLGSAPGGEFVFFVVCGMGVVAGISFFMRMVAVALGAKHPAAKFFIILVGIGGGIVIFVIAVFAGFMGALRNGFFRGGV